MRKEILAAGMLMLLTGAVLHSPANAKAYQENGFNYEVEDNEAVIYGRSDDVPEEQRTGTLEIPDKLGDFKVTKIMSYAFNGSQYEEIKVPDSVTYIGSSAFADNYKLKKVQLPKNLTAVESNLFNRCEALGSIDIPRKVEYIGAYAFLGCISLKAVTLPDSVKEVQGYAFYDCYKLKDITWSAQLQSIGSCAFYKNYALASAKIPAKVKRIEDQAFGNCQGLKTIQFKNPSTKLGTAVFSNCSSLTKTVVPAKIKTIPERTFYKCKSIRQLRLPSSVKIVKREAFRGCESLKKVKLNGNIYALGDSVFAESGLQKIVLNRKLQFVGNGAFKKTDIHSIAFSNKLTYIGNRLFSDCTKLKKVSIPASVKGINPGAFSNCVSLRSINVASDNGKYSSQDGVLYNKNKTRLIQYPMHKVTKSFTVPSSVKNIRGYSFAGNSYLQKVTITAKKIGKQAFYNMDNLSDVTITDGAEVIADNAFREDSSLKNVDLPDSLTNIGSYAFSGSAIRTVNIPSGLKKLGYCAFGNCYKLKKFEGGNGKNYRVKDDVLYNGRGTTLIQYPAKKADTRFVVPNRVKNVKSYAFDHVSKMKALELGRSFRNLAYKSITKCSRLKSVMFTCRTADDRLYINSRAVANCDQLAVIIGPNSYILRSLANSANATFITM